MDLNYHPSVKRSWFNIAQENDALSVDLYLYDDIGMFGVKAKDLIEEVNTVKAQNLKVHINSYGGEIDEGIAIYSYLSRFPGEVTIYIDGIAASIASVIAMAGDKVIMSPAGLMYIHNPWTMTAGDAEDLQREAANLTKRKAALVAVYAEKTGLPSATIEKLMDDETLLNAEEAVELGFADEIESADRPDEARAYAATMFNRVLMSMARKLNKENTDMTDDKDQEPVETKEDDVVTPDSRTDEVDVEAEASVCPHCGKTLAADEEDEPKAEEMPEEEKPEAEEDDKEKYNARAEFKNFVNAFGPDRAANYFAAGLSMAEAKAKYSDELVKENADLRSRLESAEIVKPVGSKPSDQSESPATFTREQIRKMSAEEYRRNRNAINKAQSEGRIK
jgi:ATP-dependent protease ClpP protease subunit/glutaredoxin